MISADEIWELPHCHIGRQVHYFKSARSTNDLAAALGADRRHAGIAILANQQSAGRGQYGRSWQAPAGSSVLLSIVLQPPIEICRPALLTAWAAVSICELILQTIGRDARIKWPNDVMFDDRKVCGILIEQGSAIVAGIGLNVNQTVADFQAAGLPLAGSLSQAVERPLDTNEVARTLLAALDRNYESMVNGELAALESAWRRRLGICGFEVLAETFDGIVHRGKLRECAFAGLVLERSDASIVRLMPEQVRALTRLGRVGAA